LKLKGPDGSFYKQWSMEFKGDDPLESFQPEVIIKAEFNIVRFGLEIIA